MEMNEASDSQTDATNDSDSRPGSARPMRSCSRVDYNPTMLAAENSLEEELIPAHFTKYKRSISKAKFGFSFDLIGSEHIKNDSGQIYAVCWNNFLAKQKGLKQFAVAGIDRVSVINVNKPGESAREGETRFSAFISFEAKPDMFYTVCWSVNRMQDKEINRRYVKKCKIPSLGTSLLLTAGEKGIIRVIAMETCSELTLLKAHGGAVNDLKVHPNDPRLLLSSSKDYSLRLWNLATFTLVCIFGGSDGHLDQVVAADFAICNPFVVSGGADWTIKIWSTEHVVYKKQDYEITKKLQDSEHHLDTPMCFRKQFQPVHVHFPYYSTNMINLNIVDSVSFFLDDQFILSKSIENKLVLWKPGLIETDLKDLQINRGVLQSYTLFCELMVPNTQLWFTKFGVCRSQLLVACGNELGQVNVFNFENGDLEAVKNITLQTKSKKAIRHVAFSYCDTYMACVSDDAKVFLYEITKTDGDKKANSKSIKSNNI